MPWLVRFWDDPLGADVAMRYHVLWHRPYEATCSNFFPDIYASTSTGLPLHNPRFFFADVSELAARLKPMRKPFWIPSQIYFWNA